MRNEIFSSFAELRSALSKPALIKFWFYPITFPTSFVW
jgi:hypothetical protein